MVNKINQNQLTWDINWLPLETPKFFLKDGFFSRLGRRLFFCSRFVPRYPVIIQLIFKHFCFIDDWTRRAGSCCLHSYTGDCPTTFKILLHVFLSLFDMFILHMLSGVQSLCCREEVFTDDWNGSQHSHKESHGHRPAQRGQQAAPWCEKTAAIRGVYTQPWHGAAEAWPVEPGTSRVLLPEVGVGSAVKPPRGKNINWISEHSSALN